MKCIPVCDKGSGQFTSTPTVHGNGTDCCVVRTDDGSVIHTQCHRLRLTDNGSIVFTEPSSVRMTEPFPGRRNRRPLDDGTVVRTDDGTVVRTTESTSVRTTVSSGFTVYGIPHVAPCSVTSGEPLVAHATCTEGSWQTCFQSLRGGPLEG